MVPERSVNMTRFWGWLKNIDKVINDDQSLLPDALCPSIPYWTFDLIRTPEQHHHR